MLRASVMSFFPTRYADEMNCLHNVVHKTVHDIWSFFYFILIPEYGETNAPELN